MINIARGYDDEDQINKQLAGKQTQAPRATQQKQGLGEQAAGMGMNMLMNKGLKNAMTAGTAETGLMSGMGAGATAAMPYVGMGLLAGKMLGFFSSGGRVGPLSSASYKSAGGEVYKLSYGGGPLKKGV